MYLNKVTLIGNLTRDPELKAIPSGINVVNVGLATNRSYKDKDGNKKDEVEFHNLVAFGKQAEVISQWCKKGGQLMVEGRLSTKNWESDGKKMYKTEIIVENFQFGNKPKSEIESTLSDEQKEEIKQVKANYQNNESNTLENTGDEINPDDIPF